MKYITKSLPKSQVEFEITVPPADYQDAMQKAAARLSERAAIKGFRPGKAPYDVVKQQLGEAKILEEAIQDIVEKNFFAALKQENLDTIGSPELSIQKSAPGNDFVFKAVAALLPKVKIGDLKKIKVKRQPKEIKTEDADSVLSDLRKMQTKEVLKTGHATKDDKIVIDLDMFVDKVPMEGGQAKNHQVYLNEPHYIPGLADQLVGLKKDDSKEFTLKFPKEHYNKLYAGKDVDFKVKVKDVFELQSPEANEEFAKSLGQESLEKLKGLLKENLQKEAEQKEGERLEAEIWDKLMEISEFDELPEVLIHSEKHKMFRELKYSLEHRGLTMEQYLKDLKKTEAEIENDFSVGAAKRVKAALLSRQISLENNLSAAKEEVDKEAELIKSMYKDDKSIEDNLKRPEVRETLADTVRNRKVVEWLKQQVVN